MKKAIIVGATSGIGRELAKTLIANNYIVGITGRREQLLSEIKKENPEQYHSKTFDIKKTDLIPQQLNELVSELGGCDVLIISSGTGEINHELNFDLEKPTIDTNVSGFTCVADWGFNYFKNQQKGHLVAITSIAGLRGSRHAPAYNASKAYQISYLQALKQKATKLNLPITITDVRPGFVNTAMAKGEGLFWVADAHRAAKQIYSAIVKKRKTIYVTKRWRIIASIIKLLPTAIYNKM